MAIGHHDNGVAIFLNCSIVQWAAHERGRLLGRKRAKVDRKRRQREQRRKRGENEKVRSVQRMAVQIRSHDRICTSRTPAESSAVKMHTPNGTKSALLMQNGKGHFRISPMATFHSRRLWVSRKTVPATTKKNWKKLTVIVDRWKVESSFSRSTVFANSGRNSKVWSSTRTILVCPFRWPVLCSPSNKVWRPYWIGP